MRKRFISVKDLRGLDCIYCGDPAESRDHVVPFSYNHSVSRTRVKRGKFKYTEVVPSCWDCNCVLNNKFFTTIAARAAYVSIQLVKRYKKKLDKPSHLWIWHRIGHCAARAEMTKLTPERYWTSIGLIRTRHD